MRRHPNPSMLVARPALFVALTTATAALATGPSCAARRGSRGAADAPGAAGAEGAAGLTGPVGIPGPVGIRGPVGPQGPGVDVSGSVRSASAAPGSPIPVVTFLDPVVDASTAGPGVHVISAPVRVEDAAADGMSPQVLCGLVPASDGSTPPPPLGATIPDGEGRSASLTPVAIHDLSVEGEQVEVCRQSTGVRPPCGRPG